MRDKQMALCLWLKSRPAVVWIRRGKNEGCAVGKYRAITGRRFHDLHDQTNLRLPFYQSDRPIKRKLLIYIGHHSFSGTPSDRTEGKAKRQHVYVAAWSQYFLPSLAATPRHSRSLHYSVCRPPSPSPTMAQPHRCPAAPWPSEWCICSPWPSGWRMAHLPTIAQ